MSINIPKYIDIIITQYLDCYDSINFSLTYNMRNIDLSSIIQKKKENEMCLCIKKHLINFEYHKFSKIINKLVKISISFNNYLDILVNILLNDIGSSLPTIWINSTAGYYDIRYLFDLLYYGGRIEETNITNIWSKIIYEIYYSKIIDIVPINSLIINNFHNREIDINVLCKLYPSNNTMKILKKDFVPYPKNEYNKNF